MSSSRRDHTEKEKYPLDVANEIENQINRLIEDTVILKKERKLTEALEKAKEGGKKEQALRKHRKAHSLPGDFESELMYATWFNLARAYEANDMLAEAMQSYTFLLKQRKHPLSGRLRINMGNIYYAQHDYSSAIKMYKMALDQIRKEEQSIVHKIRRNIGNAFFRLGKIRDAVKSYEEAMDATSDVQTGFNLLICHLALGDIDNAKKDFTILIEIPFKSELFEEEATILQVDETPASWVYPAPEDNLNCELETRTKEANRFLLTAARLLASSIEVENWSSGYEWVQCVLKDRHEELAIQIELEQAIQWLKRKEFGTAVKMLKSLENNGHGIKAVSATNLSFLTFLEGDIEGASEFADVALDIDRYNAKALVNKGNCLFISGDYALAKDFYLEAIGVQADCVQSIFNLGLTNVQLGLPEEAIRAFEKMHKITPNNPAVIYQIADIYELQGKPQEAIKWFNVLAARVPSDSAILSRLGYLYSKAKDDSQGLHYQLESFRHFPVDLDVISSIGAWFVQQNMYEKSIYFFQQAALMQPKEIKWGKHVGNFLIYRTSCIIVHLLDMTVHGCAVILISQNCTHFKVLWLPAPIEGQELILPHSEYIWNCTIDFQITLNVSI